MTKTELLAGILELISEATETKPAELPLTGALDKLYLNFRAYLSAVHDVEIVE